MVAQQIDDGAAGVGGDAVLFNGGAEIVSGKAVVGIERAGADEDAVVERENGTGLNLARHGDEPEGRDGLRRRGQAGDSREQRDVPRVAVMFSIRRGLSARHHAIVKHQGVAADC